MKRQFVRLTSGWIPVSVLLLLIVALVVGQAEANLPGQLRSVNDGQVELYVPDHREPRNKDRTPILVDAFLMLAVSVLSAGDGETEIPDISIRSAE